VLRCAKFIIFYEWLDTIIQWSNSQFVLREIIKGLVLCRIPTTTATDYFLVAICYKNTKVYDQTRPFPV
jgi:hypothetical protein